MPVTIQKAPSWDPDSSAGERETVPALIPDSPEVLDVYDVWLREVHLVNESDQLVTVTLTDGGGRQVVPAVDIKPYSDHLREFGSRYCPGGLTWQASVAGAVTGYARWRR